MNKYSNSNNALEKFKLYGNTNSNNSISNLSKYSITSESGNSELIQKIKDDIENINNNQSPFLIIRYIFIIFLIFIILINVLKYYNLLPDNLVNLFKPILNFFGHSIGETIKQTTKIAGEGGKAAIDFTTGNINDGINTMQNNSQMQKIKNDTVIDDKKEKKIKQNIPKENDSMESIKSFKNSDTIGYCYVGTDRGHRSCIDIIDPNQCMSGDIFPTRQICINPNLRV